MLVVSWLACGFAIGAFEVRGRAVGLAMGAVAFALLIAAELAVSRLAFGRSPAQFLAGLATPAGALGLASQVAFGLFPLFRSGSAPIRGFPAR
jgi:hypothetical protein